MTVKRPWKVHTQQWVNDRWGFWILAPNNATVAKSCHEYTTERGAIQSAVNLLAAWRTNGIEVVER